MSYRISEKRSFFSQAKVVYNTAMFSKITVKELYIIVAAVFLFSIGCLLPSLVQGRTFRLDSDYDMFFSYYAFSIDYIKEHDSFPRVHPYAGIGLPLAGDPGIGFYNPVLTYTFLLFGMEQGMYILLFLCILFSACSMWAVLHKWITHGAIRILVALLYACSGALAARFASGHYIFFLTYWLWPIVWWSLWKKYPFVLGSAAGIFFISGDIYGLWFTALFTVIAYIYALFTKAVSFKKTVIDAVILASIFVCISLPKLYFLITDVLPVFERTYKANPFEGSIHAWWSLLPFIVPFKVQFFDRPFFQRFFGFYFNWYEYYAYISPLPFLLLFMAVRYAKNILSNTRFRFFLFFSLICIAYISAGYPYSPFYWMFQLIPQTQLFRVPQRIVLPFSSLLLILTACSAFHIIDIKKSLVYILLYGSLAATMIGSFHAVHYAFEFPRKEEKETVQWLAAYDQSVSSVTNLLCCNQTLLIQEHIPVLNFYAGWKQKGTPEIYPPATAYILSPSENDFSLYGYTQIYNKQNQTIWKKNE